MEIAKVIGNVWATKKEEGLIGQKLLVLKIMESKEKTKNEFVVASDMIGAGIGDCVIISRGAAARYASGKPQSSIDAAVVGIVDSIEVDENE